MTFVRFLPVLVCEFGFFMPDRHLAALLNADSKLFLGVGECPP